MSQAAPLAALLELPFDEVIKKLGGPGRAALVMRALRDGQDPFEDERVGQRTKREPVSYTHLRAHET